MRKGPPSRYDLLIELNPTFVELDANATIVAVSESWRAFALTEGCELPEWGVGRNYLDHCNSEPEITKQLKQLLSGSVPSVTFLYPCHSPSKKRWFVLQGLALPRDRTSVSSLGHVTLFHIDVTDIITARISPDVQSPLLATERTLEIAGEDILITILREAISDVFEKSTVETREWTTPSPRELEVICLIARGHSNAAIANALGCSTNTVKRHVTSIMKKLRIKTRTEISDWHKNGSALTSFPGGNDELARKS